MNNGRCIVCPDCLTRYGMMVLCPEGEACRFCGAQPDPAALTNGDIRKVVRAKHAGAH